MKSYFAEPVAGHDPHQGFSVRYAVDQRTGRVTRKLECGDERYEAYEYRFDGKGHLTEVWRNECLAERYEYDPAGRRIRSLVCYDLAKGALSVPYAYDGQGRLVRAGREEFFYDAAGNLAFRRRGSATTAFVYEKTLLREVTLPNGETVHYDYDDKSPNPVGPCRKFKNGALVMEYSWLDPLRLEACADYATGLVWLPHYDNEGRLHAFHVKTFRDTNALASLFGIRGGEAVIACVCDQVGTPKAFKDSGGRPVKHLWYDSFGNLWKDTRPDLFIPIGFAGGLADRDTGLVRFGYRDYDPGVGRFTSPDPAQDMRGDGDIYDYCVDDPVSLADPAGLNWVQAALGAASLVQQARPHISRVMAAARPYTQAALRGVQGAGQAVANGAQAVAQGIVNTSQTLINTGLAAGRAVERGVTQGTQAITEGARRVHIASQADTKVGQALRLGEKGAQAAEGYVNPSGVLPDSFAGKIGSAAAQVVGKQEQIIDGVKQIGESIADGLGKLPNVRNAEPNTPEELRKMPGFERFRLFP